MFTADDEEDEGKESLKLYHASLGGKIIELKGHGHYTMDDMETIEFPELENLMKLTIFKAYICIIFSPWFLYKFQWLISSILIFHYHRKVFH